MKSKFNIKKRWYLIIIFIMILSNIPPLKYVFRFAFDEYHYRYSNETGSFTFVEFKAHDTKLMYRKLDWYKSSFPQPPDTVIFRLFNRNPLSFWRWGEYVFDGRYKLPYKSWREIKQSRSGELKYSNNWKDF